MGVVVVETPDPAKFLALLLSATERIEQAAENERHVVIISGSSRIRLCVVHAADRNEPAYTIMDDGHVLARLAALHGFCRGLESASPTHAVIRPPKPYQRHRLNQLLRVYDGHSEGASAREIAYAILFRRHESLTGSAWKASSERRHTLRLIAEACRMVDRDYRKLLQRA